MKIWFCILIKKPLLKVGATCPNNFGQKIYRPFFIVSATYTAWDHTENIFKIACVTSEKNGKWISQLYIMFLTSAGKIPFQCQPDIKWRVADNCDMFSVCLMKSRLRSYISTTVPSPIRKIFSEFPIFWDLFHQSSGE